MVKSKIIRKGNSFKRIKQSSQDISKESVQIGFFDEQGKHSSGFSYPELMAIHEYGIGVPSRPVFSIVGFQSHPLKSRKVKSALRNWGRDMNSKSKSNSNELLEEIGKYYQRELRKVFGNKGLLQPNSPETIKRKKGDKPLIDSGELKGNIAYKTSTKDTVTK